MALERMSGAFGLAAAVPVAVAAGAPVVGAVIAEAAVGDYTTAVGVGIGAAAIVIAIVQALKLAGLPARYAAVVSVAVGVGYACLVHLANLGEHVAGAGSWANTVAVGLSLGLGASGLYSGVKAVATRAGVGLERTGTTASTAATTPTVSTTATVSTAPSAPEVPERGN